MQTVHRFDPSEPRRPTEATPFVFTPSTAATPAEITATFSMGFAGLSMITRWYGWAWVSIFLALSSLLSKKDLTGKQTDALTYPGWSCVAIGFTALFSVYGPILTGQATKTGGQIFGWAKGTVPLAKAVAAAAGGPAA